MNKLRFMCLAATFGVSVPIFASGSANSEPFFSDSSLSLLLRNAYISRDYNAGRQDKAEWGQAAISRFSSGYYTAGFLGLGFDAFGMAAVRLDGGGGRSGANGIDFFKFDSDGKPAHDLSRAGGAVKVKVSKTLIQYGDLMPALPVLNTDDSRLLPENFTGVMITSKELSGVELTAGHFTAEVRKSATGRDSGGLKEIDVLGGAFSLTDNLSMSAYHADVEGRLRRSYASLNYVAPLTDRDSVTLDFNGYRTQLNKSFAQTLDSGRDNKIWSLGVTYKHGPHDFTLAYQRSTGDSAYVYGGYQSAGYVGDGGGTIFLANSYWSDFNAEDERSWQIAYGVNLSEYGFQGLSYRIAFVEGTDINTPAGSGEEREIFNQLQYVVQSGTAKNLKIRLRSSWVRVSNNASYYNQDGDEIRLLVEYPINVF